MVTVYRKGVAANAGDDITELSLAIQQLNNRTAELENGASNTEFLSSEPTETEMSSGVVYVWTDTEGLLVIGGLDESTGNKITTQTQVNVEDPGLIGGIVGGLI